MSTATAKTIAEASVANTAATDIVGGESREGTAEATASPQASGRGDDGGLRCGRIELAADERFVVRFADGSCAEACAADGVSLELLRQCLEGGRPVLVEAGLRAQMTIVGCLQIQPSLMAADGTGLRIDAGERLTLTVGASSLTLHADGTIALNGQRIDLNGDSLVRVQSGKVQLP